MENIPTILNVVALALIDGEGRVLLQRRRMDTEHGGLWEFPGGKVQAGESPESAIVREIEEELAIRLSPDDLSPCSFSSAPMLPGGRFERVVILLYTARKWAGKPECLDAEKVEWFVPREICRLPMPPADYPLVEALTLMIEQGGG